jgi:heptosyltransferase-3
VTSRPVRGNRTLRFLDRFVGIPLILAWSQLDHKQPFDPFKAKRIGLMKTVAIGDTMLISGVARDVKRRFDQSTIVLITGEDNRAAGQMIGVADEHVVVSPHDPFASIQRIRDAYLDVLIDFGAWPRFDAFLAAASAAGFRVGFRTPGQARHFAYDVAVDYSNEGHELDNFRRLATVIGVDSQSPPAIEPPGVLPMNRLPRGKFVVCHAWPGGYMHEVKEWPTDHWVKLAGVLNRRGWTPVLTGAPSDRDKSAELLSAITAARHKAIDLSGTLSLPELADLLLAAEAVISVNTGILHLAAAVGARTISLDGPTSARRWGPISANSVSVESTFEGCGYLNLGWEYAGQRLDCMSGIGVPEVVDAIDALRSGLD